MEKYAHIPFYVCVGAEIDFEDKSGNTALHIAARYGHELIITALLKHGANMAKLVTADIHHLPIFLLSLEMVKIKINPIMQSLFLLS